MRRVIAVAVVAAVLTAADAGDAGWENVCPERTLSERVGVVWQADFGEAGGFELERHDGAQGEMEISGGRLRVVKANDAGYLVIRSRSAFAQPVGRRLKSFADAETTGADPNYSLGFPRIVDSRNRLNACFDLDAVGVFMGGGEKIAFLANTAPGMVERKLSNFKVRKDGGTNLVAALVIAGAPSRTLWHRWGVQDYDAAAKAWGRERAKHASPSSGKTNLEELAVFERRLAGERDHTAKVVRRGGRVILEVDGADEPPILFKNPESWGRNWGDYNGRAFVREGIRIQDFSIGGARHWTNGEWNVGLTIRDIRDQMRCSPDSLTMLTLCLSTPREYAERHPDEQWRQPDGTPCVGQFGHMYSRHFTDPDKTPYKPKNPGEVWPWVSLASKTYRRDMERTFAEIIRRLKAEGLSKRIIGFHLSGWHDGQFAMYRSDYSKPAKEGFREYLRERHGKVEDNLEPPVPGGEPYFDATAPQGILAHDYNVYQHLLPLRFQDGFAQFLKREMGKDIVCLKWCMCAFSGTMNGVYCFDRFFECRGIDGIVAQPSYVRRLPGNPLGNLLPLGSFVRHGKLYLDEFDLRAWGTIPGYVKEESVGGLGFAMDLPEWQAVNRKMAGRMIAADQGYWYYDISGGFWNPDEIERDIGAAAKTYAGLRRREASGWKPSAAFVTDADGMQWRNHIGINKHPDEQMLVNGQIELLAASGVPFVNYTYEDVRRNDPALEGVRVAVLAGFHVMDRDRRQFVETLLEKGKTVVLLAGTGGYCDRPRSGRSLEMRATDPSRQSEFRSRLHALCQRWLLGVTGGNLVAEYRPTAYSFEEGAGTEVLARYACDGAPAVIRKGGLVAIGQASGLTPRLFSRLVREAGGYVPVEGGVQVDMNGNFVSLVALDNVKTDFTLPFVCDVVNLKTGKVATRRTTLPLALTPGEVRWYALTRRND